MPMIPLLLMRERVAGTSLISGVSSIRCTMITWQIMSTRKRCVKQMAHLLLENGKLQDGV